MNEEKPKIRLKPVIYTTSTFKKGEQNTTQQMFLLKALQITQDPKKLRQMIGVKSVAEVYRTLDKLAMRKEYHEALAKAGVSFDYIVGCLKQLADEGFKDADNLKALQTILKSVGMDVYKEDTTAVTGTWEEALLKKIEAEKENGVTKQPDKPLVYDVQLPVIPESARLKEVAEDELTSSIYDSK